MNFLAHTEHDLIIEAMRENGINVERILERRRLLQSARRRARRQQVILRISAGAFILAIAALAYLTTTWG